MAASLEPRFPLAAWLNAGTPRCDFELALAQPWCRPSGYGEISGNGPAVISPAGSGVGVVAAVTAQEHVRATLLRIDLVSGRTNGDSDLEIALDRRQVETAGAAVSIATQCVPFVLAPRALDRRWRAVARIVASVGQGRDAAAEGPSLTLPLVLAGASLLLDLPLPCDFVATGEVKTENPGLELESVGFIREKMCVIADAALGVSRVLVPWEEREAAAAALQEWGAHERVKVVGVRTAKEALEVVFGGKDRLRQLAEDAIRARTAEFVEQLIGLAWRAHVPTLRNWRPVGEAARVAAGALPDGATKLREQARLAAAIAARHADDGDLLIEWPSDESLDVFNKSLVPELLAQIVASAAAAANGHEEEYVQRAASRISAHPDRSAEELKLAGAIGRTLAAVGHYDQALRWLREAIEGWRHRHQPAAASFPLCEYARVVALISDDPRRALGRVAEEFVTIRQDLDEVSERWLDVAMGRAYVLAGDPVSAAAALGRLDDPGWAVRGDLGAARLRWLARCSDVTLADMCHARLVQSFSDTEAAALAALDRALRDQEDAAPVVAALRARPGIGPRVVRLEALARDWGVDDAARFVANHYLD